MQFHSEFPQVSFCGSQQADSEMCIEASFNNCEERALTLKTDSLSLNAGSYFLTMDKLFNLLSLSFLICKVGKDTCTCT